MIVGIGVDVAEISRLERALARTPSLAARLFAESERVRSSGRSLAGCFAVKEAAAKALGAVLGHEASGKPLLTVQGTVAAAAAALGVSAWHVSISHDGGLCVAMVVAER
jgi:holo-[acyl-carrier protein] synthase